jgi:hypothetical protein
VDHDDNKLLQNSTSAEQKQKDHQIANDQQIFANTQDERMI